MSKAVFFHAACRVCFSAGHDGVQSVPALVIERQAFHINCAAGLDYLK